MYSVWCQDMLPKAKHETQEALLQLADRAWPAQLH